MRSAKLSICWDCNLRCPYCVNQYPGIREAFKPITKAQLWGMPYDALDITGGEPLLRPDRVRAVLAESRPPRRHYLWTNGLLLPTTPPSLLKRMDGINVGYHAVPLPWDSLIGIHWNVSPIRLWVQDTDCGPWMDALPLEKVVWTKDDCLTMPREHWYYLEGE